MRHLLVVLLMLIPALATAQDAAVYSGQLPPDDLSFADWPVGWFTSTSTDIGLLYYRPRVSFGYGRPHYVWAGIDLNPTLSLSGPGGYAGLRLAHPIVDLRVGSRASYSLQRASLAPQEHYDQDDVFMRHGPGSSRAAYVAAEAELTLDIPAGFGRLASEFAATYIFLYPEGRFLLEERLNVVVEPPWLGKARLGYRLPFTVKGVKVGIQPAGEVLVAQGRPSPTVRAGLLVNIPLSRRLSVRANLMHTVASPDRINFTGSNFGEITLRWRGAWRLTR